MSNNSENAVISELTSELLNDEGILVNSTVYPVSVTSAIGCSEYMGSNLGSLDNFFSNLDVKNINIKTLDPGSKATAEIRLGREGSEQGKYKNEIYVNLGIPKGEKGIQGEKGDSGVNGTNGQKGDPFTYDDFTPEQLEGLKGEKGDPGKKGNPGIPGKKGQILYYSGNYDLKTQYETTDQIAVCVKDVKDNNFYILNEIMVWDGSSKDPEQKNKYPSESDKWLLLENYHESQQSQQDAPKQSEFLDITDLNTLDYIIYIPKSSTTLGTIRLSSDIKYVNKTYTFILISETKNQDFTLNFDGHLEKDTQNRIYYKTDNDGNSFSESTIQVKGTSKIYLTSFKSKRGDFVDWYMEIR